MQQLTSSVFAETQIRGCNHGFVVTSEGVVMIDSAQKPSDALKLKEEIAKHGELRYIINTEPHGDHWRAMPILTRPSLLTRECDSESWIPTWKSMWPGWPAWARKSRPCWKITLPMPRSSPSATG